MTTTQRLRADAADAAAERTALITRWQAKVKDTGDPHTFLFACPWCDDIGIWITELAAGMCTCLAGIKIRRDFAARVRTSATRAVGERTAGTSAGLPPAPPHLTSASPQVGSNSRRVRRGLPRQCERP